jgi:hypothetical protein
MKLRAEALRADRVELRVEVLHANKLARLTVGATKDDGVAVEVAKPNLAMRRPARFPLGRIAMRRQDDLRTELTHALDSRVEVVDFEPQQDAIATNGLRVAHVPVVMVDVPCVELHDQTITEHESLVRGASVVAPTAEKRLIPTAARLYLTHDDHGLWSHSADDVL